MRAPDQLLDHLKYLGEENLRHFGDDLGHAHHSSCRELPCVLFQRAREVQDPLGAQVIGPRDRRGGGHRYEVMHRQMR